jgi:hypothetical protein
MQISVFIRYLILTRGIEEGLLASTREKHNTGLGKVNKQQYNHYIFVNYAIMYLLQKISGLNIIQCHVQLADTLSLNRCLKTLSFIVITTVCHK